MIWSVQVKNYLMAHDLRKIIEETNELLGKKRMKLLLRFGARRTSQPYLLFRLHVEQIHFLVLKRLVLHAIKKCLEYFGMNL
jgi:hypothetical protein